MTHDDLIERAASKLPQDYWPESGDLASYSPPAANETRHNSSATHALERTSMIDWSGRRTPIMEEIRLIKRRLLRHALNSKDPISRLIMLTSAKSGEGKTFICANLALCMSLEEDYEVLIVDADIHKQSLCRNLGIKADHGFVDLLLDPSLDLPDVLLRTDIPRLSILPAGRVSDRTPELMAGSKMRAIVGNLITQYPDRIIIFDSPPCLASTDASTIASHVGQAVFIVEANQTQEHEVSAALQHIGHCPDISLVLNKTELSRSTSYGAYGAY